MSHWTTCIKCDCIIDLTKDLSKSEQKRSKYRDCERLEAKI